MRFGVRRRESPGGRRMRARMRWRGQSASAGTRGAPARLCWVSTAGGTSAIRVGKSARRFVEQPILSPPAPLRHACAAFWGSDHRRGCDRKQSAPAGRAARVRGVGPLRLIDSRRAGVNRSASAWDGRARTGSAERDRLAARWCGQGDRRSGAGRG